MNIPKKNGAHIGLIVFGFFFLPLFSFAQSIELNDPQILSVTMTINQCHVNYAKTALNKSNNKTVRQYAQTMADNHTQIINQTTALEKKLILAPQLNLISRLLTEHATNRNEILKKKRKKDFDIAYIDSEVALREIVLSLLKNQLIHQARNEHIKNYLSDMEPLFEQQLDNARKIQTHLNR